MIKGPDFDLEATVSVSTKKPTTPKKPKVDRRYPKNVIEYKGRFFEVPREMIFYLADLPEVLSARIERTIKNGLFEIDSAGGYGCHYCDHNVRNLKNTVAGLSGKEYSIQICNTEKNPDTSTVGCQYKGKDVRWAKLFGKQGIVVMAQRPPCVVFDSMIAELVEIGLFDEYEVKGRKFDFPTLAELDKDPELQKQYEIRLPHGA